jgi:hypothetical protein
MLVPPVVISAAILLALHLILHGTQPRRLLLVVQALQVVIAQRLACGLLPSVSLHFLQDADAGIERKNREKTVKS